jgi:hypothetical protein
MASHGMVMHGTCARCESAELPLPDLYCRGSLPVCDAPWPVAAGMCRMPTLHASAGWLCLVQLMRTWLLRVMLGRSLVADLATSKAWQAEVEPHLEAARVLGQETEETKTAFRLGANRGLV